MMPSGAAMTAIKLEVCVDSIESAVAAQQGGAHRLELCDNMAQDGTTPSSGTITITRQNCQIPLHIMIRPRGGDFYYSEREFQTMQADIHEAKRLGADGVVLGLLNPDGTIDAARTATLISLARPLAVTFHRAFDMTPDLPAALEALIELGVERVLTSGGMPTVTGGLDCLADLIRRGRGRIIVMPGGGITAQNIRQIAHSSSATELHISSAVKINAPNPMTYHNPDGGLDYTRQITDAGRVHHLLQALEGKA